jgi:hypothetical protein
MTETGIEIDVRAGILTVLTVDKDAKVEGNKLFSQIGIVSKENEFLLGE